MARRRGTRQNPYPSPSNSSETERDVPSVRGYNRSSLSNPHDTERDVSNLLDGMQKQMREQREHLKKLSESYDFMSGSFDSLHVEIKKLTNENKKIKKDVAKLRSNEIDMVKRIQALEKACTRSKQEDNSHHMIITNLPKFDSGTNLRDVVAKIGEQVAHTVSPDQILDIYQNENKQNQTKTYPMIVKLRGPELKSKCMDFRKNGKKIDVKKFIPNFDNQTVNVNFHHLVEREYASLLKKAKDVARSKQYKYVWIKNSTILVRKTDDSEIIKIRNDGELVKIV